MVRPSRPALVLAGLVMTASLALAQGAGDGTLDLDRWHELRGGLGILDDVHDRRGFSLGIYPGVSAVLGLPGGYAGAADLFVSIGDGRGLSLFAGYGREWGARADATVWTLGWGGVKQVPAAEPQLGFFGTFVRYREWEHDRHGRHRGLSVGTESGVGLVAVTFEAGLARSERDHWLVVARLALKLAFPVELHLDDGG